MCIVQSECHLTFTKVELHIVWKDVWIDHVTSSMTLSSVPWCILRESRGCQLKTTIWGASLSISYDLWDEKLVRLSKMEYCYSGADSLLYGNWNCHVCHKLNCKGDLPSWSTGVNLDKKQTCCFLLCLWFQQDTSLSDRGNNDFNFHVINFPFLSSNIPFHTPMGFLSHSVYDMPGLASLMNVLLFYYDGVTTSQ